MDNNYELKVKELNFSRVQNELNQIKDQNEINSQITIISYQISLALPINSLKNLAILDRKLFLDCDTLGNNIKPLDQTAIQIQSQIRIRNYMNNSYNILQDLCCKKNETNLEAFYKIYTISIEMSFEQLSQSIDAFLSKIKKQFSTDKDVDFIMVIFYQIQNYLLLQEIGYILNKSQNDLIQVDQYTSIIISKRMLYNIMATQNQSILDSKRNEFSQKASYFILKLIRERLKENTKQASIFTIIINNNTDVSNKKFINEVRFMLMNYFPNIRLNKLLRVEDQQTIITLGNYQWQDQNEMQPRDLNFNFLDLDNSQQNSRIIQVSFMGIKDYNWCVQLKQKQNNQDGTQSRQAFIDSQNIRNLIKPKDQNTINKKFLKLMRDYKYNRMKRAISGKI